MNVLVTGSAGALGRNLVENLKAIRDGKNRTRPVLHIDKIYEYDRSSTPEELDSFCTDCDFIVHAAGVNRPKEQSEFMEGNFGFTSTLLDTLKKHNNLAPIMITSSVQQHSPAVLAIRNMAAPSSLAKSSCSSMVRKPEPLCMSIDSRTWLANGSPLAITAPLGPSATASQEASRSPLMIRLF